jgi:hypothetical protein
VRRAVIVDVQGRRLISVPLLPMFDKKLLVELLRRVSQIEQPNSWPGFPMYSYYRVEQFGENDEYVSIQPVLQASDGRFYAVPNVLAVFNVEKGYVVEHGKFWTPKFVDLLISTLS